MRAGRYQCENCGTEFTYFGVALLACIACDRTTGDTKGLRFLGTEKQCKCCNGSGIERKDLRVVMSRETYEKYKKKGFACLRKHIMITEAKP